MGNKLLQEEKIGFKKSVKLIGKALKVSLKNKSKVSVVVSVIGLFMAVLPTLIGLTYKDLINEVQTLYSSQINIDKALWVLASLAGLYIIQSLYFFARDYYLNVDTVKIQRYIKEVILNSVLSVRYKYIENYDGYEEKIGFAEEYSGYRTANSISLITLWFQYLITFVSILIVLLRVNLLIVLILIGTCVPAVILSYLQKDEDYRFRTKWMTEGRMVIRYFAMCSGLQQMGELRHWGIVNYLRDGMYKYAKHYFKIKNSITKKHLIYNSLADFLRSSVFIGILLIISKNIYSNSGMDLGIFMLIFTLAKEFQKVTARLFVSTMQFLGDVKYINDFFELENLDKYSSNSRSIIDSPDIEYNDVSFTYPNTTNIVLNNVNVKIKYGEKIAIVGANGSGKTTFINLLCGMYYPDKGQVLVGNSNTRENLSEIRNSISVVFQDFAKYDATLRENITISDLKKESTDQELIELTTKIGSHDVLERQKTGLDEMLGIFSEEGNTVSGGQWQKIALTRAGYRDSASIIILDEPTAALDPLAEADLYRNFAKITGDKTTLLISHRLGITKIVNRILVFKNGEIVEDGSHEELIKKQGVYEKMYKAQAKWYQS